MRHQSAANGRAAVPHSASTAALLGAYDRLRKGNATLTDGTISVTNVAREAGFSRATAYRCAELLAKFERARKTSTEKPKAPAQSGTQDLRTAVQQLLNRIIVLDAVLKERDGEIARLRALLKSSVR
jgi:hypothetical protein